MIKTENYFDEKKVCKNVKITKRFHAYAGYKSTCNVKIQLKDTESTIRNKPKDLLTEMKRFKFVTTLVCEFKKMESDDETKYSTFYSASKAKTIINESDIVSVFKPVYSNIVSNVQKSLGESLF